ncbi:MAG: hypothetical protein KGI28_10165 [Thaumarchaeota archaeon]|nr:hypothetical protein [Nitrososphaerota archaeon]
MKRVVSVSKTYIHRGNHRHKSDTKRHWFIYYYDDEGNFRTERVNQLQAMYYKARKWRRIKLICTVCWNEFLGIVKSKNDAVECPYGCEVDNGEESKDEE